MVILGLTGSIGMGKSETARMFRAFGVPVYDADAAVHRIMQRGGEAVPLVAAAFPGAVCNGVVNRPALGAKVFGDAAALRKLEGIIHPLVREAQRRFLATAAAQHRPLVVMDIPLLFESGGDRRCDATVVVSAPARIQRARVLARANMTVEKLAHILHQQMPDAEKRRRTDFIVQSGLGRRHALRQVAAIIKICRSKSGRVWPQKARVSHRHGTNRGLSKYA